MAYKRVSDSYISKIINKPLSSVLYGSCYNLSAIISDYNGFMPKSSIEQMSRDLKLVAQSTIPLSAQPAQLGEGSPIPPVLYENEVSVYASNLYNSLISIDSNNVYVDLGKDKNMLLSTPKSVPPDIKTALGAVYLEAIALYYSLLSSTPQHGMKGVSRAEISRMMNNIRWLSIQLEMNDYQLQSGLYEILKVLRDLYKTTSYIHSLDVLFVTTYEQKLNELYGGGGDV